jgi:hypothetical protein
VNDLTIAEQIELLKKEFYDNRSKEMRIAVFFITGLSFLATIFEEVLYGKFTDHFSS